MARAHVHTCDLRPDLLLTWSGLLPGPLDVYSLSHFFFFRHYFPFLVTIQFRVQKVSEVHFNPKKRKEKSLHHSRWRLRPLMQTCAREAGVRSALSATRGNMCCFPEVGAQQVRLLGSFMRRLWGGPQRGVRDRDVTAAVEWSSYQYSRAAETLRR